jgi:hydroxymethylglutaryl-CoA synthase
MSNMQSYGYYLPQYKIEENILAPQFGRKGKRSVAYVDEDIITLAYEAASNCLKDNKTIDGLFFATSSPVFQKRYHASFLADLLNLPNEITALDFGSTPRAATDALLLAHQLVDAGSHKNILVVAADMIFPSVGDESKNSCGHAACAILVGSDKGIAEIKFAGSYSGGIAEEFIYKNKNINLDSRFARDAGLKSNVKSALEKIKINPANFDAVIMNALYSKLTSGIFLKAGFSENQFAKDNISSNSGYTSVCHALLQLIDAIENNKKNILLFDYFNGTNVLEIKCSDTAQIKGELSQSLLHSTALSYHEYLTLRKAGDFDDAKYNSVEMFSSEMMNEREKETLIYLNGYECTECKTVYIIKSARCKKCHNTKFELKKLERTGTVYTLTKEYYFPHSFPPITMAVIDLDNGGRVTLQMTDDLHTEEKNKIQIGSKVKLVLRKMMENGAKPDYFWKAKLL